MSQPVKTETSPWCWNSRRWLILGAWELSSCPYPDIMRIACVGCGYYEDKPVTKYFRRMRKILEEVFVSTGE